MGKLPIKYDALKLCVYTKNSIPLINHNANLNNHIDIDIVWNLDENRAKESFHFCNKRQKARVDRGKVSISKRANVSEV